MNTNNLREENKKQIASYGPELKNFTNNENNSIIKGAEILNKKLNINPREQKVNNTANDYKPNYKEMATVSKKKTINGEDVTKLKNLKNENFIPNEKREQERLRKITGAYDLKKVEPLELQKHIKLKEKTPVDYYSYKLPHQELNKRVDKEAFGPKTDFSIWNFENNFDKLNNEEKSMMTYKMQREFNNLGYRDDKGSELKTDGILGDKTKSVYAQYKNDNKADFDDYSKANKNEKETDLKQIKSDYDLYNSNVWNNKNNDIHIASVKDSVVYSPQKSYTTDVVFLKNAGAGTAQKNKNFVSTSKEKKSGGKLLDKVSDLLTAASLIPGLDTVTNLASIPVDLARGDLLSAGLSAIGVFPVVGEIADAAKIAKATDKVVDTAKAVDKAVDVAETIINISPSKLIRTQKLTLSKKQYSNLLDNIRKNGIIDPIRYVEYKGTKYVVDGHHRLSVAEQLKLDKIPAQKVSLPYKGYKTINDLLWVD